ncbi:alpha/beta fold hydrolase [Moraxella bovis]|uniref:Alpha/beta hydrolase n=1 Tax=Moraxella bovis TaxID=476 RepID=A0AAQ2Q6W3_MORBO|nr:alpha/beta hydrolase [Moraxella bovis]UYZ74874.1 alpha/beta hydrolase [Moraxella bovis]UYZ79198.1 alpha/beta hydrolase [Moraxella bovis]UYZ87678.1 alpha/beta hydrolase [Moraxella bovis]UYZ93099.1 alpha/beta hydrolase [Moraxella bovis]UYZ96979.1 alpha/beta hydrolase [Moraxella bovis]
MTTTPFDTLPTSTLTGKPVLHFVHANGFPSQVYAPLFEHWEQVFSIEYIELFGTHPDYPLDNHWQGLTEQVLDSIREACDKHGVPQLVAVGHSVGAVTTMQACDKDPTHISQVIALDPSLLMGKMSLAYQLSKVMDNALRPLPRFHHYFVDKISPASKSKYRKDTFDSRQIAHDSLRQKGLFRAFDARTFDGYIQHGLTAKDDKFTLAIPKAVELAIFRTIPSLYWAKSLTIYRPTTLIAGKDSHFTHMGSYHAIHDRWGVPVIYVGGSHMFPLETPDSTAHLVLDTIAQQIKAH